MGNCQGSKEGGKNGLLNVSYTLWAQAVSIQAAAGITLFYIGYQGGGFSEIKEVVKSPSSVMHHGWKVMEVLGILHILMSAVVALMAVLGYFLSNCFFIPLCVINILQTIFCSVTFGVCKFYLSAGFSLFENYYKSLVDSSQKKYLPKIPVQESKLQEKTVEIVIAGSLSLATIAYLSRVGSKSDPSNQTNFIVLSTALCSAIGAMLLLPSNIKILVIMGTVWLVFSTLIGVLYSLGNCCSKLAGSLILGIMLILVAVYSIVTISTIGLWYIKGRSIDNQRFLVNSPSELPFMGDSEKNSFLIYVAMEHGTLMLFALLLAVSQFYVSVFGGLFAIRNTLLSNDDSNKVVDSTEEI